MSVMMISQQMIADATKTAKQMFPCFSRRGYEGNLIYCANTANTSIDFEIEQLFGRFYLYNDLSYYVKYGMDGNIKFSVQNNAIDFADSLKSGKHLKLPQFITTLRFLLYNIEDKQILMAVTNIFGSDMVSQLARDMRELKVLHDAACVYYAVKEIEKTDVEWCY